MNATKTTDPVLEEKILRFKKELEILYDGTMNAHLEKLVMARKPLYVKDVLDSLQLIDRINYTSHDVGVLLTIIRAGGNESDIPAAIADRISVDEKVTELLELYAEIVQPPLQDFGGSGESVVYWYPVAEQIDPVTAFTTT